MPVSSLLDLELSVPDPDGLVSFWQQRGMRQHAPGVLGTADRPVQLRVRDGAYRHVSEVHLGCDQPSDLDEIAARLDALGLDGRREGDRLRVADPINDHDVVVSVARSEPLSSSPAAPVNRPGAPTRLDVRAAASQGTAPAAPRRVGHVVFGTPDLERSVAFYVDGLGLRVSDVVGEGVGWFLRCSTDHHNLLLAPSPVPCLNHYALEMDDIDAIGAAAAAVLAERPDGAIAGPGRHVVGANLFWYLLDPAGGMFELFADMDQIEDDEAWERTQRRDDWDPFGIGAWMPGPPKPDFFLPADLDELARARAGAGR